jgi:amino acid adenylation domain-containing protein
MEKTTYQFIWSYHHLLLDGWSVSLVLEEVFAFYEAFCLGQNLHLKHSRPYEDYIAWLQQQDLTLSETFWRQVLKGFTVPTSLRVDRALGNLSHKGENYSVQQIQLSVAATTALQSFARQHQLTINTLVQGAWALLLERYSGEQDVVFGATVSGRPPNLVEVESMVGLFINTLPVRVQVSPDADLLSWLKEIQAQLVELRSYEYSPLLQVQGWSEVPREVPLFESIVVFENYPVYASKQQLCRNLDICNVSAFEQTNYPLTLIVESAEELMLLIRYDCDRFDAATITQMLRHLQTLLEGMVVSQGQRLAELSLLTEAERQQLLVEWNHTQVDYPQKLCIHQLFEDQVERTPDAIAVVFENQQLTYFQLNNRANCLAHYLRTLGIGPDVPVGICVERSLDMVVGLLGILKAGGAYVPLDPAYPLERLAFMLEDVQTPIVLTQKHLAEKLPAHWAQLVYLDSDWEIIAQQSAVNPHSEATPENLAYVIYTSGSTGKPKGTQIPHRSITGFMFGVDYIHLDSNQTFLQYSSVSWDALTLELWPALLHGGRCVLYPGQIPTPDDLQNAIQRYGISTLLLTPALFNTIIDSMPEALLGVQQLLVGGEAISVPHVRRALELLPSIRIVNGYGPSECTVFTCCYPIPRTIGKNIHSLPIGRPIGDRKVYILDSNVNQVPIGVSGELYISGASLARGYLNEPELTAVAFIPNPFSQEPGARLYKTGDLVRYLNDGNIEFVSRIDDQVKIRGFRIELGEIESMLAQHPQVREAVIIVQEDKSGDKRLVAYVSCNQEQLLTVGELRSFLQNKLPKYMIPVAIVLLLALPLTPNGKVDRRALPAPNRNYLEAGFVAPRDPLELQLVQIWEKILNVHPIGVQDNFFDLGGHSLVAVRLMSQIQQQFKKNLTLATLFQGQTIEQLATILRQQTDSLPWSPLVTIQSGSSQRPLFCVHPAGGNVLCYYDLALHLGLEQPLYGLQARGLDGQQEPYTRVEDMAAYYIEAMQAVQPQGPYLLAGWSFGGFVAFEMAQQLQAKNQQVALLAMLDTRAPFKASEKLQEDDDAALLVEMFQEEDIFLELDRLRQLELDKQLIYVIEQAKQINLIPPDFGLEQGRRLLQVYKSQYRAARDYMPQPYPGRITFFQASEQAVVALNNPTKDWGELAAFGVETYRVPGNHQNMLSNPHVQVLARQIRACLERVQANKLSLIEQNSIELNKIQ